MKFCVYGPAGAGKTTVIRKIAEAGLPAFDLEDLPDAPSRELALQMADNVILGGADTKPTAHPTRCNILLWLPDEEYAARRAQRDAEQPEKAEQPVQTYDMWMDGPWAYVIPATGDVNQVVERILQVIARPRIPVPPKPRKNADNWSKTVADHAAVVYGLLSWNAWDLTRRGACHDMDKLERDNPSHHLTGHHWFAKGNQTDVVLNDLVESAADAAATTLGRYNADPWVLYWWFPPQQTAEWWEDVYARTMAANWRALDTALDPTRIPGWGLNDAPTTVDPDQS